MASVDTLVRIAPQYATEDPAVLVAFLSDAALQMAAPVWGRIFELGAANLAAHMLTLRDRSLATAGDGSGMAAVGGPNSIRTGGLSINFGAVGAATASGSEVALRTTPYGLEFLRLRSLLLTTPVVA